MRAERACPDASKFETFIPLAPLVFELELFKPTIDISVFGSETRSRDRLTPKFARRRIHMYPQLSFEIQVFTFSRFKVMACFIFVAEFVNVTEKK